MRTDPDAAMSVRDWERLARLATNEALDCERDRDDRYAATLAKSYRALAAKCSYRADELEEGRVVP